MGRTFPIAVALALVACAADRNKDIQSAQANLTSERAEARYEQERLDRKEAAERAAAGPDPELDRAHAEERADARAEANEDIAAAQEDVAKADAAMRAERVKVEGEARSRLAKADARAWEAKNKSAKIRPEKRAKFDTTFVSYERQKLDVQLAITNLPRATNAEWQDVKGRLDKQLDALEAAANRLHDDL